MPTRGLAASLAALLLLGLPPATVSAQQAVPSSNGAPPAEPEMPPLPSLEGQQGEVISHGAVSAPARKHRAEASEPAKRTAVPASAGAPVKGAAIKGAAARNAAAKMRDGKSTRAKAAADSGSAARTPGKRSRGAKTSADREHAPKKSAAKGPPGRASGSAKAARPTAPRRRR